MNGSLTKSTLTVLALVGLASAVSFRLLQDRQTRINDSRRQAYQKWFKSIFGIPARTKSDFSQDELKTIHIKQARAYLEHQQGLTSASYLDNAVYLAHLYTGQSLNNLTKRAQLDCSQGVLNLPGFSSS